MKKKKKARTYLPTYFFRAKQVRSRRLLTRKVRSRRLLTAEKAPKLAKIEQKKKKKRLKFFFFFSFLDILFFWIK